MVKRSTSGTCEHGVVSVATTPQASGGGTKNSWDHIVSEASAELAPQYAYYRELFEGGEKSVDDDEGGRVT